MKFSGGKLRVRRLVSGVYGHAHYENPVSLSEVLHCSSKLDIAMQALDEFIVSFHQHILSPMLNDFGCVAAITTGTGSNPDSVLTV